MSATAPVAGAPRPSSTSKRWRPERLHYAIAASVALHAALMSIHFAPPDPIRFKPLDSRLEVILLNAKGAERPVTPDVVAQVDMQAGGDRDEGRATSPLAAEQRVTDGDAIVREQQRVRALEEQQRQLMALARSPTTFLESPDARVDKPADGTDAEDMQFVIARLQAQIARNIYEYNKRPRRLTYGVNAVGASYARYVSDWSARIEEIGTERYPAEARGRFYDSLVITVEIQKDGHVGDIIINRKSRYDALNNAVRQIVLAGAPYEPFTPEMSAEGDILQIVRTWTFTNESLTTSEAPVQASQR